MVGWPINAERHRPVGRHLPERLRSRRHRRRTAKRGVGVGGLLVVLGPGLLAGLSDDDPPGITTYSILGADYGYRLLWVLAASTAALIVFHEVAARTGIVTGKGLLTLVRERHGPRVATGVLAALMVANFGTLCAEFAGIAAAFELVGGVSRYVSVPLSALVVALLVSRGSFHRVEHVLLALSALFVAYIAAGVLAQPDWAAAGQGLVVPSLPAGREAVLAVVAVVGTTLAPWGLVFIQSYAVDKKLSVKDLRFERIDVATGAVLTGVIGFFVVIACAATLHGRGVHINDAGDAAQALKPLAGDLAAQLFGAGFLGAALLGIAVVPLSSAYSVAETFDKPADLNLGMGQARAFYGTYIGALALASGALLLPGIPLVDVLYLSQALNAVLLLAILPFLRRMARDPAIMGEHRLGRAATVATGITLLLVALSVIALAVLTLG